MTRRKGRAGFAFIAAAVVLAGVTRDAAAGDFAMMPEFAGTYGLDDLGPVPGLPSNYGGVAFDPGDPDTLLIAAGAVSGSAAIYAVPVTRGCFGEITGFAADATFVASSPFIDSGLTVAPGGTLLYTTYDGNTLGQITPGQPAADRLVDLSALGVTPSTGSAAIVPAGFPGAGRLKIGVYDDGDWYDATLAPDGSGTFDIAGVERRAIAVGNGLEGIAWIAGGQPNFPVPHVLVNNWDAERIDVMALDAAGDPDVTTRRTFALITGPEGAAGDWRTPDIIVSSLGPEDHVAAVRIPGPCAADVAPVGGDGSIGAADLIAVLANWEEACTPVNFDRRGVVGFGELLSVLHAWGPCP
ncbi:MAG: hypothetical protein HKN62_17135 [Phycisphaerales bacterium]|nr:hypothetical protein [Phycisphaerales bacterium]